MPVFNWHEIRRRRKSEGGQKFLPPNPLPFCPPELNLAKAGSKFSVRIFAKKSSDFVQRAELINKKGLRPFLFVVRRMDKGSVRQERDLSACYLILLIIVEPNSFLLCFSLSLLLYTKLDQLFEKDLLRLWRLSDMMLCQR